MAAFCQSVRIVDGPWAWCLTPSGKRPEDINLVFITQDHGPAFPEMNALYYTGIGVSMIQNACRATSGSERLWTPLTCAPETCTPRSASSWIQAPSGSKYFPCCPCSGRGGAFRTKSSRRSLTMRLMTHALHPPSVTSTSALRRYKKRARPMWTIRLPKLADGQVNYAGASPEHCST
jgi:hypothetical protein